MKPSPQTITAEYVREILDYSPETGIFIRKKSDIRFVGKPAGFTHHTGYRVIKINGRPHFAHRLAWLVVHGVWPGDLFIDHINGIKIDNRICNLRKATNTQNLANTKKHNNETGFRGVQFDKRIKSGRRWIARIAIQGKKKYLGAFHTAEEAADAFRAASIEIYGAFASA